MIGGLGRPKRKSPLAFPTQLFSFSRLSESLDQGNKGYETGPPVYSPYPRRLVSLTICGLLLSLSLLMLLLSSLL